MKQSSIEWFAEKTFSPFITEEKYNDIIRQAKAMHKKEIEQSYYDGIVCSMSDQDTDMLKLSEQYYNETFNTKEK